MSGVLEDLRKVRTLVSERWAQNSCAVNAKGLVTGVYEPDAERFCALGAMYLIGGTEGNSRTPRVMEMAEVVAVECQMQSSRDDYLNTIIVTNDNGGQEMILRAIDATIGKLEAPAPVAPEKEELFV